jgi:outer membrane beta-barrel protein
MKLLWLLAFILTNLHGARASEESLYDFVWLDPDKKVYVLQNKLYQKEHSLYFDLGYISNYTSKFQDTYGFQGKLGYYFHEEWGIEVFGNYYNNVDNDDVKSVQIINQQRPFIRRLNLSYGLVGIWSPFYGKINTFNKIFYFDWSFGAGVVQINGEDNLETSIQSISNPGIPDKFESKTFTGGVLKSTVKFHLNERYHIGIEYMNTYFAAPSPKDPKNDKLRTNTDVILSAGISI